MAFFDYVTSPFLNLAHRQAAASINLNNLKSSFKEEKNVLKHKAVIYKKKLLRKQHFTDINFIILRKHFRFFVFLSSNFIAHRKQYCNNILGQD